MISKVLSDSKPCNNGMTKWLLRKLLRCFQHDEDWVIWIILQKYHKIMIGSLRSNWLFIGRNDTWVNIWLLTYISLHWVNLNIVILPYYISNDSIFIMLKTSQKFPEMSLSHFFNTWLAITENFWDHFPSTNFEPIWLYRKKNI